MQIGNAQHAGRRPTQQDAFAFSNPSDVEFQRHGGTLAVLADGMGGLAHGSEASRAAVRAFLSSYEAKRAGEPIPDALHRALLCAHRELESLAGQIGKLGSTLVAAVVSGNELHWIAVGDSPLFLIRDGHAVLVTTPHVYAVQLNQAAEEGVISLADAAAHNERESLTSNLGPAGLGDIDRSLRPFRLRPNDRILLCSDGLSKILSGEEIASLSSGGAQQAAERLVHAALERGVTDQDNITVLTLWNQPQLPQTVLLPKAGPSRKRSRLISVLALACVLAAGSTAAYWRWRSQQPASPAVSPRTGPQFQTPAPAVVKGNPAPPPGSPKPGSTPEPAAHKKENP